MKLFKRRIKDDLLVEEESDKGSFLSKKVLIPIAVVIILILALVVKAKLGLGNSGEDFYDTVGKILTTELGYYKYTLDVRTGDKGTLITKGDKVEVSLKDLNNAKNVTTDNAQDVSSEDTDTKNTEENVSSDPTDIAKQEDTSEVKSKKEFKDWNNYADIKEEDWKYPNYTLTIEGNTTSLQPLKTNFKVSLTTSTGSGLLTEVYCIDKNYYIDVESLYNFLKDSGDNYLVNLGKKLPRGSKWLTIPEDQFKITSRYAEEGEQELSGCDGLVKWYRRFLIGFNTVKSSIQSRVGSAGQTHKDDLINLSLSDSDADNFVSVIKDIALKSGDFYSSTVETGKANKLYSKDQYTQALREKDNFIRAMYDLGEYLQITDISSLGTKINGSARVYKNGFGNEQVEATINASCSGDSDCIVQFSGIRAGDKNEFKAPSGSQNKENNPIYRNVFDSVFDYLNFTKIKTDVKLEATPETISDDVLTKFVDLVNTTGTAGYYVTKSNVSNFIKTYSDSKKFKNPTNEDNVNLQLVSDLAKALNEITKGVVIKEEVKNDIEQYPKISFNPKKGVECNLKYSADDSDSSILVIKGTITNKTNSVYKLDTSNISLRTLLNSIYPANNATLLHNVNNTFDINKLETTVVVKPNKNKEFKLYFVPAGDDGHMDMYYKDINCGSAIEY